jgi:hypothetical protein
MANKVRWGAALLFCFALNAGAQNEGGRWADVDFPHDSPILPVSFSLGPTTVRPRGTSMVLDLHASLLLRNTGAKTVSGLTLRVEAQDLTPSGKGAVTVPSLQVRPGEVFPVRIDLQLQRPFNMSKNEGAIVQVSLDCALFADFSHYGPDQLHSRRALMVYELQARRDRRYMADLLQAGLWTKIREELNFGLQDLRPPQQLGFELSRDAKEAGRSESALTVGTMSFRSAPVQAMSGAAQVVGNEVRAPRIEVKNVSQRPVRGIDMGWIIRDEHGRDFVAGSMPAQLRLDGVETGTVVESETLRFSRGAGQPISIGALLAFVNDVEFADGKLWIPSRNDIEGATGDPILRRALSNSPEQQRLAEIYRKKGSIGLASELKRTNP